MEIANWKSQNEILRKPGVVRWFIVSTIREKASPIDGEISMSVYIDAAESNLSESNKHIFQLPPHSFAFEYFFFVHWIAKKGVKKIFEFSYTMRLVRDENAKMDFFLFRVLYKEIFIHSLPPDSPRELPFWDPFLIFQPLRRRNILKCTWRHKWATTWDDFSSSNCAQRIEFFADAMKFFPHCNICLWLQGISLLLLSAQTQKRLNFFLKSYDLCDDYCFTSPLVCVWEQIVCRRNRIALWYIRAFE